MLFKDLTSNLQPQADSSVLCVNAALIANKFQGHIVSAQKPSKSRRQFLGMASSAALIAGVPWLERANVNHQNTNVLAPADAAVAKVRIYPTLGICRVGGSEKWFFASEIPGLPAVPDDGNFKDGLEKIKKQAQRFRVYAFDATNHIIGEMTGKGITWSVHLASTKADWYGFNNPLDTGDLASGLPSQKQNQFFVTDQGRAENLIIDGGARDITGLDKTQMVLTLHTSLRVHSGVAKPMPPLSG